MSQENVQLVYRYGAALNAREIPEGLLAPDFVMVNATTAVTDKTYHGAADVVEWKNEIFEAFGAGARFEIKRVVADEDDFVVATVRLSGSGGVWSATRLVLGLGVGAAPAAWLAWSAI
jgi:ketosteroid isomerase-like protein